MYCRTWALVRLAGGSIIHSGRGGFPVADGHLWLPLWKKCGTVEPLWNCCGTTVELWNCGTTVELLAVTVAFEAARKKLVMESFGGCCDYKTWVINLSTENVFTERWMSFMIWLKRLKNFRKFSHQRLQTETRTKNGRKRSEKAEGSAG